ncbi:MAG TPA: DUF6766 family protein [Candidatus Saccharimonadales bacterium]|nr:DUF6766 family protein [Candidatus Saccharimonadales bacterium]
MKQFLKQNSLSIVLFGFFLVFLLALSVTGYLHENEEMAAHAQPAVTYVEYITSGGFVEAVFENWESEFLQMGALVVLTIWLVQKGSADSKKLRGKDDVDTSSRYSIIYASSWANRKKAAGKALYANSLSLALFGLFFVSLILHAIGGTAAANQEAVLHHQETMGVLEYVRSSQFWFESFQNWQSEFLAVGALLVLSIFLRQRGSPESKPIGEPNKATGSSK